MNIAAVEHGAGGRVYLRFEKYMQQVPGLGIINHLRFNTYVADGSSYLQPLPANKFGPGDVVAMKRQQVRSQSARASHPVHPFYERVLIFC
jgi:hypothetical protein